MGQEKHDPRKNFPLTGGCSEGPRARSDFGEFYMAPFFFY